MCTKVLLGKPEEKNNAQREENIKMDFKGVEWIHLAQDGDKWMALLQKSMELAVSVRLGEYLE
jgi:hypothetical protein